MWRVDEIILSRGEPTNGGPSASGLSQWIKTPQREKYLCYEIFTKKNPQTLTETLVRPKKRKIDMRFGT
jgi:hypothetical protein